MKQFFRSVLGDVPIDEMGVCYSHEHIVIDESFTTHSNSLFLLNDVELISKELKDIYKLGCRTMVDTMPADSGRNVLKLAEISKKSKVNIIVPTGIHLEIYYLPNHWRYSYSEEQLTQLFIDDITLGIDANDYNGPIVNRTRHKAGVIKLATGDEPITKHQTKIFRAVVNAHKETGAPILTHSNFGKHAIGQVEMFEKLGADLSHVVISHVDRYKDVEYNRALLEAGVRVEYDSSFRWKSDETNWTYKLLENLLPDFPEQITVGMDASKKTYWKSYGGKPGLGFLLTQFKDDLKEMGLDKYFDKLFINNPAKLFQFKI